MASLAQTQDKLYALKGTTNALLDSCKLDSVGIFKPVSQDLSAFLDVVIDLLLVVYKPQYKDRPDLSVRNKEINFIVSVAEVDFASLDSLLRSVSRLGLSAASARSISPSARASLNDIANRIHGRTESLRNVLDHITKPENLSKLGPKSPKTPPPKRNVPLTVDSKNVSFASSAVSLASLSSSGRSGPPSPYKPTVEEVPDTGEDENDHGVIKYHLTPTELTPLSSSQSNKSGPSKVDSQELPKVILRAPTDPSGLEESIKELSFDGASRDTRAGPAGHENINKKNYDDFSNANPRNPPRSPKLSDVTPSTSLVNDTRKRTISSAAAEREVIGDEIRRLESELQRLRAARAAGASDESPSSSMYASSKYSSDSLKGPSSSTNPKGLGLTSDERLDPRPNAMNRNRPRASTTSNVDYSRPFLMPDRHHSYYTGSDSFKRGRDRLDASYAGATSPRETTFISPLASPRTAPSSMHTSPRYAPEREFHESRSRRGSKSGSDSRSNSRSNRWMRDAGAAPLVSDQGLPPVLETGRSTLLDDDPRHGGLGQEREGLSRRTSKTERDRRKRSSWAPAPDRTFGNSPNTYSSAHKRSSWAPNDDDDDDDDWRRSDFQLFSDSSASAPQAPPSPSPATAAEKRDRDSSPPPPNVIIRDIPVTLEDIFRGSTLQVRLNRIGPPIVASNLPSSSSDRLGPSSSGDFRGRSRSRSKSGVNEEVLLTVKIPRGLQPGSKLKYVGQGDWLEDPNRFGRAKRGDLWLRLKEKPHDKFLLKQLDLHTHVELTMQEALCGGWTRTLKSICGREMQIGPGTDTTSGSNSNTRRAEAEVPVTRDGRQFTLTGLGMPKYKPGRGGESGREQERDRDGDRGDLVILTRVIWPKVLADWQRDLIMQALGGRTT